MVLDDVADDAGLFVKGAAAGDADRLRHRDLDVLDVVAIPERLQQRVGEPEIQQVLHRLFPEIVIDTEDAILRDSFVQRAIERLRRREVAAKRLLDDDARTPEASGLGEVRDHDREHARRNGEVERRVLAVAQRLLQLLERGGIVVVAVNISDARRQRGEGVGIEAARGLHAFAGARHHLLGGPS